MDSNEREYKITTKNNLKKSNCLCNNMKDQVYKHVNEKEKRERYLASQLRYAAKPWTCTNCEVTIRIGNKTKHLKSKKHLLRLHP